MASSVFEGGLNLGFNSSTKSIANDQSFTNVPASADKAKLSEVDTDVLQQYELWVHERRAKARRRRDEGEPIEEAHMSHVITGQRDGSRIAPVGTSVDDGDEGRLLRSYGEEIPTPGSKSAASSPSASIPMVSANLESPPVLPPAKALMILLGITSPPATDPVLPTTSTSTHPDLTTHQTGTKVALAPSDKAQPRSKSPQSAPELLDKSLIALPRRQPPQAPSRGQASAKGPASRQPKPEAPELEEINLKVLRAFPVDRVWVEIPVPSRVRVPRPPPRPPSPPRRKFHFFDPEPICYRFNKECQSKVLQKDTLPKRMSHKECQWSTCDAVLGSEWQLQRHLERAHIPSAMLKKARPDEMDAWACEWSRCGGLYRSRQDLMQHLLNAHFAKALSCPYTTCPYQDKVYHNIAALENHITRMDAVHHRTHVKPLVDLSISRPIPFEDRKIPPIVKQTELLPIRVYPAIWTNTRRKCHVIDLVQENSFADRKDLRMHAGETPPPIDQPMPNLEPIEQDVLRHQYKWEVEVVIGIDRPVRKDV